MLACNPAGVKSWTYRYRLQSGKQKRLSLGKLEDLSLADARNSVTAHRVNVAKGGDPANEAILAREIAKQRLVRETVKDVGDGYFNECIAGWHKPNLKRPKHQSTIEHEHPFFTKHSIPAFGSQKLIILTRAQIQAFVDKTTDNFSFSAGRKSRIVLHGIFAFAERQEIVQSNPCKLVTVASQPSRERVLTVDEVKTIWLALTPPISIDDAPISSSVAYSILIALVTLQRRGEVTGMRIDELDQENRLWIIPSHRTKNNRIHVVPLSELAIELISKAIDLNKSNEKHVFPSPRNADKSIEAMAMTRDFARIRGPLELVNVRPHDFWRTGATMLTSERLGFLRFTVSKVLNHTRDTGNAAAVTAVYDRNKYLPKKRRALNAWAKRLIKIVKGQSLANNIINLRQLSN